jgi:hypothetical protein
LLSLEMAPIRCGFDSASFFHAYSCDSGTQAHPLCETWSRYVNGGQSRADLAEAYGTREGSIVEHHASDTGLFTSLNQNGSIFVEETTYSVVSRFDESFSLRTA